MTDDERSGAFERAPVGIDERITADRSSRWPVAAGRYRLVAARACPWANRAVIVRRLLGLEDAISMGIAGPLHDERSWRFHLDPDNRDPVLGIEYPSGIVPAGPDLCGWHTPHGRAELGGRPFGDGTPPGSPPPSERVPSIG